MLGIVAFSILVADENMRARADFTDAVRIPNTPYSFATGLYPNGIFPSMNHPEVNFFPITGAPVPGSPNLLGIPRQYGGLDLIDINTGSAKKLIQLPIAPYPYFAPQYNQVKFPGSSNPVDGELYIFSESGLLGTAFHPNFAAATGPGAGKFYVNATVDNRDLFIPGIDPTNGIDDSEVLAMNLPGTPANDGLKQCFHCELGNQTPIAGQFNGSFTVYCNTPTVPKIDAIRPSFMEVREYTVNKNGSTDPVNWTVDANFNTILRFQREREYHNAGSLAFGPDGMLYIASGDSKGSPSQAITHPEDPAADFFGKILRIDVNGADAYPTDPTRNYAIPANNPFKSGPLATMNPADDEVYAYGMRNPWRIGFDAVTGDLWIGDVGYNSAEEVNVVPAGTGGQNFGWPYYEGTAETPEHVANGRPLSIPPGGPPPPLTGPPEHFYTTTPSSRGSVIGGFVYRGPDPTLQGDYLFYELIRRQVWSYDPATMIATNISHKIFDDDINNVTHALGPD
jgi:hypothetical protein